MLDPRELLASSTAPKSEAAAPLGGTRAERVQRLQIGVSGVLGMVLLIALADIVTSRAEQTEANAVPEAAPTVAATEDAQSDPLVDAGVVPDLPPATPAPEASQEAAIVPEQGGNAPVAPPAE